MCFGAGGGSISVAFEVTSGVGGTVEGAVEGPLEVGKATAGGGRRAVVGMLGSCTPLSEPSGGEVLGVGAEETSDDAATFL